MNLVIDVSVLKCALFGSGQHGNDCRTGLEAIKTYDTDCLVYTNQWYKEWLEALTNSNVTEDIKQLKSYLTTLFSKIFNDKNKMIFAGNPTSLLDAKLRKEYSLVIPGNFSIVQNTLYTIEIALSKYADKIIIFNEMYGQSCDILYKYKDRVSHDKLPLLTWKTSFSNM